MLDGASHNWWLDVHYFLPATSYGLLPILSVHNGG